MDVTQSDASRALGDLVAAFHVEASRHPDTQAMLIRMQADALDAHRILNLRGELSDDDALAWLDSGRKVLADLVFRRIHPDSDGMQTLRERIRGND